MEDLTSNTNLDEVSWPQPSFSLVNDDQDDAGIPQPGSCHKEPCYSKGEKLDSNSKHSWSHHQWNSHTKQSEGIITSAVQKYWVIERERYENPILHGNDQKATAREKWVGSTVAKDLRERIRPYFLRRLKSEVFHENSETSAKISRKEEIIVWLRLTHCHRQLYEAFLNSETAYSSVQGSPLAALTVLKKICDHPSLLTKKATDDVLEGMDQMLDGSDQVVVDEMMKNITKISSTSASSQPSDISCKIKFLMSLLENLVEEDHKVLVFPQTCKMLDIIQDAINSKGYGFLRIDGTTKARDRQKLVNDFQDGIAPPIFLLTSQVGGLGLTLTKADRVIVVDPAWNPRRVVFYSLLMMFDAMPKP